MTTHDAPAHVIIPPDALRQTSEGRCLKCAQRHGTDELGDHLFDPPPNAAPGDGEKVRDVTNPEKSRCGCSSTAVTVVALVRHVTCVYLIMPTSNTACFQVFLEVLARKFARQDILLVLDGAPNHRCSDLAVPDNITLLYLPPYSPELNPKENLWDEIREKVFKNYALKSMDAVRAKLAIAGVTLSV
jgi:hypothetical protein